MRLDGGFAKVWRNLSGDTEDGSQAGQSDPTFKPDLFLGGSDQGGTVGARNDVTTRSKYQA